MLRVVFDFVKDDRGLYRAERRNGWVRCGSQTVRLFNLDGSSLPYNEEKRLRALLVKRLKHFFGYHTLKGKRIKRYQLTLMCYSMYGFRMPRSGKQLCDCHHLDGADHILSHRPWKAATNDRISNLEILTRPTHKAEHYSLGDYQFKDYNS